MKRDDNLSQTAGYKAQAAANNAHDKAEEAGASVREVAHNFGNALDDSLSKQPMTTLALAVAVGFILGAIWKA